MVTVPPPPEPVFGDTVADQVRLLIDTGRAQDAVRLASEGLRVEPESADLIGLVGWALLGEGDATGARAWAERSLAVDPDAGWVHDLRARALLDGAGTPDEARSAARTAVRCEPARGAFHFTLVGACLACHDRLGAEQAVQRLRQVAPGSERVPLAAAMVELDKSRAYLREISPLRVVVLTVLTQGAGLFLLGLWWIVQAALRAPHLRRADAYLHDALRMETQSGWIRLIAAEVLRHRFRFAQSVDYEVAAAAIDADLVDADELASSISRRTSILLAVGSTVWVIGVALLDRLVDADVTVGLIGLGLAVAFVALVAGFDRWQTRSLPPLLLRNVRSRWALPTVAIAVTAWVLVAGVPYLWGAGQAAAGYHRACLLAAPLAVAATSLLLARFAMARRHA